MRCLLVLGVPGSPYGTPPAPAAGKHAPVERLRERASPRGRGPPGGGTGASGGEIGRGGGPGPRKGDGQESPRAAGARRPRTPARGAHRNPHGKASPMFSLPLSASAGCVDGDAPGAVGRALDHSPDHRAAGAATADGTFAAGTAPVRT